MNIQKRIKELEGQNGTHDIFEIFEKYFFQRNGEEYPSSEEWAENEKELEEAKEDFAWGNDGQPTGIKDDKEFYALQRAVFEKVVYSVKNKKLDNKAIATRVYEFLKTLPNGSELSTHEAVDRVYGKPKAEYKQYRGYTYSYAEMIVQEDDFLGIHNSLMGKIDMGHKYEADFSKYGGEYVGLPYNIPFVFKLKTK